MTAKVPIKFTANFDWHVNPGATVAYREGHCMPVDPAIAAAAKAQGAARDATDDEIAAFDLAPAPPEPPPPAEPEEQAS